ncbi:zinc finger CCCH domain-containing protein [Caenorhabditis elegans]|uniref:Uncharacterized protein C50C3.1 n=1 Tax=Caenorhabditis elegans TaxID=6239 RepID=YLJ1_CAEEL|nr:Uncharacterized protein CELE_C50C3.1 [Caenorhabditis elegans]P34366.3 RecName: Full=Uncharacterized protein C50C3.1 [Caenorhabditis elegans]CCD66128.1 Uncharacterized protein CELE_C50C3.1 [Caenorhabditis elegans]|eukprot:NP_498788.3 Uncharacterized protein CELE_C50C3.1 [Caenorhabditis elegans]
MFKIRKRSVPKETLKGILRKSPSKTSKVSQKVGFVDDHGKPIAEYRDFPADEGDEASSSDSHYEKKAPLVINRSGDYQINRMKWVVYSVKNVKKQNDEPSEMRIMEENRLTENNISRAPLFGTFDALDSPNLTTDAIIRARTPVPIITSGSSPDIPQCVSPVQNTYQQIFENNTDTSDEVQDFSIPPPPYPSSFPAPTTPLLALMSQLKQRGIISGEQNNQPLDNVNPMPQQFDRRPSRWTQGSWKVDRICTYYINRPDKCTRGDNCRFKHDDVEREHRQKEIQSSRNQSWHHRTSSHKYSSENSDHRGYRRHRSRSPHARQ